MTTMSAGLSMTTTAAGTAGLASIASPVTLRRSAEPSGSCWSVLHSSSPEPRLPLAGADFISGGAGGGTLATFDNGHIQHFVY